MYASTLVMHARLSRMEDAIRVLKHVSGILNEKAGTNYRVSTNLGNAPGLVLLAGEYEHLKQLEEVRNILRTNADIASALRFSEEVFLLHGHENEFDHIERIHLAGGERKEWVSVKTMRCLPGMRLEAVSKGIEVAKFMGELLGTKIGFATSVTGDLNRCLWVGNAGSLEDLEKAHDLLGNNVQYHHLMKSAQSVFEASSQVRSIWHRVS